MASHEPYEGAKLARLEADAAQAMSRYPEPRSALLPLLHPAAHGTHERLSATT